MHSFLYGGSTILQDHTVSWEMRKGWSEVRILWSQDMGRLRGDILIKGDRELHKRKWILPWLMMCRKLDVIINAYSTQMTGAHPIVSRGQDVNNSIALSPFRKSLPLHMRMYVCVWIENFKRRGGCLGNKTESLCFYFQLLGKYIRNS